MYKSQHAQVLNKLYKERNQVATFAIKEIYQANQLWNKHSGVILYKLFSKYEYMQNYWGHKFKLEPGSCAYCICLNEYLSYWDWWQPWRMDESQLDRVKSRCLTGLYE